MREVKFRGKRVDNGEWWVGDLISYCEAGSLKVRKTYIHNRISGVPNFNGDCLGSIITMVEVVPETVGQFTGVFDTNGVEIYEGDTLTLTYQNENGTKIHTRTVLFVEAMFILASEYGSGASLGSYDTQVNRPIFEVVGNINDSAIN